MNIPLLIIAGVLILISGCSGGENAVVDLGMASGCDVATTVCSVDSQDMSIRLILGPDVQPLKRFPVKLDINSKAVDRGSVVIDFQMKDMDMGLNRYRLLPERGHWVGEVTLPVCSNSRLDWYAQVEFMKNKTKYIARFPFKTQSN